MKKILTFVVAVTVASVTSAASLNWSMNKIVGADGNALTGVAAYLFITAQSSDFGATVTTVDEITSKIEKGEDLSDYIAATGISNAAGGISGNTGYYGNFGAGDSLTAFAVIFDAADYASAANYIVTAEKSASWTSSTGAKALAFGSQANATWSPTSVPEPGTAALALLGVGMLLKRRKA